MDKLEHNIRKAFEKSDDGTSFAGKDALWARLDNEMNKSNKVAAWWRVAAIFLGLFIVGGVFANLSYNTVRYYKMDQLRKQNEQLTHRIDSFATNPVEYRTEVQTVQKVVYRDRIVQSAPKNLGINWQEKYFQLQDSTDLLLAIQKKTYDAEIERLDSELNVVRTELTTFQHPLQSAKDEPFQLKSERAELGIQKKPAVNTPEIAIKIFPRNFTGQPNDLNKTIFNKQP